MLGEQLANKRRSLGKSIADLEQATHIRGKMIDALERGDYDTLPAPAYVRGYIISYAKFLDMDPEPFLKLFAEETGHLSSREAMRNLPANEVIPSREHASSVPRQVIIAVILVAIVVSLAIWGIGRLFGEPEEPAPLPTVPETSATVEPDSAPVISPESTTSLDGMPETESGAPFVLRIDVDPNGASWLRVTVDGLVAYEGTLTGPETKEYDVADSATVRIGQPSSVTVYRDDEIVEIPTNANTPEMTLEASETN